MEAMDTPWRRPGVGWSGAPAAGKVPELVHIRPLWKEPPGVDAADLVRITFAGRRWRLNEYGGRIWALCDGTRTVRDIAGEVREWVGDPLEAVAVAVGEFVGTLESAGLLLRRSAGPPTSSPGSQPMSARDGVGGSHGPRRRVRPLVAAGVPLQTAPAQGRASDGQVSRGETRSTEHGGQAMVEPGRKPVTDSGTILREEGEDALLFTLETEALQVVNHTGRLVWTLCDGTRTVDEIARAVSEQFEVPVEQVMADVTDFLSRLRELDMVSFE